MGHPPRLEEALRRPRAADGRFRARTVSPEVPRTSFVARAAGSAVADRGSAQLASTVHARSAHHRHRRLVDLRRDSGLHRGPRHPHPAARYRRAVGAGLRLPGRAGHRGRGGGRARGPARPHRAPGSRETARAADGQAARADRAAPDRGDSAHRGRRSRGPRSGRPRQCRSRPGREYQGQGDPGPRGGAGATRRGVDGSPSTARGAGEATRDAHPARGGRLDFGAAASGRRGAVAGQHCTGFPTGGPGSRNAHP